MSKTSWLRGLTLLLTVCASSAQAAVFSGVWDPKFGAPFVTDLPFGATNNLGWRGTATWDIPDTCLPGGTATVNNAVDCAGGAIVTSAQVEFYNFDLGLDPPTVATLNFNPATMSISDMGFVGGQLAHLTTTSSNFVNPPENLWQFGVAWDVEFSLFFTFNEVGFADGPHLGWRQCHYDRTYATHYDEGGSYCNSGFSNPNNDPDLVPTLHITRVPEPGTLALALFGVLGLASRRVRAAIPSPR